MSPCPASSCSSRVTARTKTYRAPSRGHHRRGFRARASRARVREAARGLNALPAKLTVNGRAPVILPQRLRKRSAGSTRGANRLVADAVTTGRRPGGASAGPSPNVLGLLRRTGRRGRRGQRGRRVRDTYAGPRQSRPPSTASTRADGHRSSRPTPPSIRPPACVSPGPRSPRSPPNAFAA